MYPEEGTWNAWNASEQQSGKMAGAHWEERAAENVKDQGSHCECYRKKSEWNQKPSPVTCDTAV